MCDRCQDDGQICVCPDDLCQAQGWCFHGDGMEVCPECGGGLDDGSDADWDNLDDDGDLDDEDPFDYAHEDDPFLDDDL